MARKDGLHQSSTSQQALTADILQNGKSSLAIR